MVLNLELIAFDGAISVASINESLNEGDLIDLMTSKSDAKHESKLANIYKTRLRELPLPSHLNNLEGFNPAYFQYQRSLVKK